MHPEIANFWENSGHILQLLGGYWLAQKGKLHIKVAYSCSFLSYPTLYIWDGVFTSEEKMLKIIKMKAFI